MTHPGPPRRMVVGYESGERSKHLVAMALELRRRFETVIHVLHAVDLPSPEAVGMRPDVVGEMEAEIQARAYDEVATDLTELDPEDVLGREDHLLVMRGRPAQLLCQQAERSNADTIMLGHHEKRDLFDFGSTTRAVISSARCDLWVQPGEPRPVRKILAPIDLSEESLRALACARDLASEYGASVTALHCFQPPEVAYAASPGYPIAGPVYVIDDVRKVAREEFARTVQEFDWKGVEHEDRFLEGSPVHATLDLQDDHDLIAIGTHGRTGLSRAVLGNVAYSVMRSATIPVLALRHPKRSWLLG